MIIGIISVRLEWQTLPILIQFRTPAIKVRTLADFFRTLVLKIRTLIGSFRTLLYALNIIL